MKMNKRVLSLDILRGISIMIVLIHHVSIDSIPNIPELTGVTGFIFWKIRGLGWSGVDLFFVLSGFLIGGLLLSELEQFKKSVESGEMSINAIQGIKKSSQYFLSNPGLLGYPLFENIDLLKKWFEDIKAISSACTSTKLGHDAAHVL